MYHTSLSPSTKERESFILFSVYFALPPVYLRDEICLVSSLSLVTPFVWRRLSPSRASLSPCMSFRPTRIADNTVAADEDFANRFASEWGIHVWVGGKASFIASRALPRTSPYRRRPWRRSEHQSTPRLFAIPVPLHEQANCTALAAAAAGMFPSIFLERHWEWLVTKGERC